MVQPLLLISSFLAIFFKRKIILEHTLLEENLPGIARKIYKYLTYRFFFKNLKVYSSGLASQIKIVQGKVYKFGAQVDLEGFIMILKISSEKKRVRNNYSGEIVSLVGVSFQKGNL